MRRAERACRHQRLLPESAYNTVDFRRFEGFRQTERGQNTGQSLGQHGLTRTGRTHEKDVVPPGRRNLECPLDVLLSFYVSKIIRVHLALLEKLLHIYARRTQN